MTSRPRWVRRTAKKVPLTVDGRAASSTDPATWSTYRQARASTAGVGVGFVLDGDGIVCVDIDHCLEGGAVAPWARELLERFPATYIEISPSGDGLHVFGFGDVAGGRHVRVDGHRVEVYGTGRFIAITGERHGGAPARLADISAAVNELV
ncbi:bifunctional DNA primase/polymerase [Actinomadura nitritigenes]|uniref:bifunctional DNA primase/polymerase n=1 Tax=Actinomadura nitritigenes TaxID=134602 RepID=UPI003D8EF0DD